MSIFYNGTKTIIKHFQFCHKLPEKFFVSQRHLQVLKEHSQFLARYLYIFLNALYRFSLLKVCSKKRGKLSAKKIEELSIIRLNNGTVEQYKKDHVVIPGRRPLGKHVEVEVEDKASDIFCNENVSSDTDSEEDELLLSD